MAGGLCFGLFWQIGENLIEPIYTIRPQKQRFRHFSKGRVLPPKTPKNSHFEHFWALRRDPRDLWTTCCCLLTQLEAYNFYQLRYLHLMIVVCWRIFTRKLRFLSCANLPCLEAVLLWSCWITEVVKQIASISIDVCLNHKAALQNLKISIYPLKSSRSTPLPTYMRIPNMFPSLPTSRFWPPPLRASVPFSTSPVQRDQIM